MHCGIYLVYLCNLCVQNGQYNQYIPVDPLVLGSQLLQLLLFLHVSQSHLSNLYHPLIQLLQSFQLLQCTQADLLALNTTAN